MVVLADESVGDDRVELDRHQLGHRHLAVGWTPHGLGAGEGVGRVLPPGQGVLLGRQLVEPGGQALGQAAGVDEDEGGAVGADQLQQLGVHGGPDAAPGRGGGRGRGAGFVAED